MNRIHLAAFAAVAETGSFTRGAEKLMVSQPALSLQVAELETSLKTKLFDRVPRGVRLTVAGELLLGYARRIESAEREAEAAIANLLGLKKGRLVVGASLTIGSYLLPRVLGQFQRAYPEIELNMEIANSQQIERMLLEEQLDLAFTEGLDSARGATVEVFAEDRLIPIASPDHPILRQKSITPEMLCREPMIFRETGSGTREVAEDALSRLGLAARPVMSLGSAEAIKRAVQAQMGLAIVSELVVEAELAAGTLAVVPVSGLTIVRPLKIERTTGRTDSPAAAAFLKLLHAVLNKGHAI